MKNLFTIAPHKTIISNESRQSKEKAAAKKLALKATLKQERKSKGSMELALRNTNKNDQCDLTFDNEYAYLFDPTTKANVYRTQLESCRLTRPAKDSFSVSLAMSIPLLALPLGLRIQVARRVAKAAAKAEAIIHACNIDKKKVQSIQQTIMDVHQFVRKTPLQVVYATSFTLLSLPINERRRRAHQAAKAVAKAEAILYDSGVDKTKISLIGRMIMEAHRPVADDWSTESQSSLL